MNTSTSLLSLSAAIALNLLSTAPAVAGDVCVISSAERLIADGRSLPDGVPTLSQGDYEPGSGDCAPTAAAMVLSYWDAHGWSCIVPGATPYDGYDWSRDFLPSPGLDGLVEDLKDEMGFVDGLGTSFGAGTDWAGDMQRVAMARDAGIANWSLNNWNTVYKSDVRSEIDADRPFVINVHGVPEARFTWHAPDGSVVGDRSLYHSMAALGYRDVVEGEWSGWSCIDGWDQDEFYVAVRMGWQSGGERRAYFNWSVWDTITGVQVVPQGSSDCVDDRRVYAFRGDEYQRYDLQRDGAGWPGDIARNWPGMFPRDVDALLNYGNGKVYAFHGDQYTRYDIASDRADPGYPRSIAGAWPGVFPRDIDAAVNAGNGSVYFFKGDEYTRFDIETDRAAPNYPRPIAGNWPGLFERDIDAALFSGNGRLYFFKGDRYMRYDQTRDRVDPGYPVGIQGNWPGLYPRDIDAIVEWSR